VNVSPHPIARSGQRLVVVIAHPDDESFGCGSLIAQAALAGALVTVVCATRGEAGERRPDPITDSWPLGLLREAELAQAAIILGVGRVEILDHSDSGFDGAPPHAALVTVSLEVLADEVGTWLSDLEPDVVLTLDGSDGHRDHVHLRDAVTLAVSRFRRPVRLIHSSLANSKMRARAEVMEAVEPWRAHLRLELDTLGRPDCELTAIDTSAVLATRERAIACHLSQVSPFDNLPPTLRRDFLAIDHIVDATPRQPSQRQSSQHQAT
jgi:LmbE family N-acetylglucosaminyl deacetylase